MALAKDKFWLFGVRPHQDDCWLLRSQNTRPPRHRSRITPAEGAYMLDVPNVALIICDGEPAPFSSESYGYAESFARLDRVMWGASGSSGFRSGNEEKFIVKLADEYSNICGAYLDDFIGTYTDEEILSTLHTVRSELDKACRPMKLNATWYFHKHAPAGVLDYLDSVTMWTWKWQDLNRLEENFQRLEEQCTRQEKIIGIYMYDFPSGEAVPVQAMEHQCEFGLQMIREGRANGLMFEANSVMGIGLESEKWLTKWIERVKLMEVPD